MKNTEKITGILVNVTEGVARKATIERSLNSYYKTLGCECIDIVNRRLGGYRFDIICDDEALLKDDPIPSAFGIEDQPMLFGNLFFCKHDGEGNEISLNDRECELILSRCIRVRSAENPGKHSWQAICRLDY